MIERNSTDGRTGPRRSSEKVIRRPRIELQRLLEAIRDDGSMVEMDHAEFENYLTMVLEPIDANIDS